MSWTSPYPAGGAQPPAAPSYAVLPSPAPTPPRRRRPGLLVLLVVLPLVLIAALGIATARVVGGTKPLSDASGRVTLSVPRSWSNQTEPDAGQWIKDDEGEFRVPDLAAGNFLGDRFVDVIVEPRDVGLAEVHLGDVDDLCYDRACIDRGQPVAVEVNGRRGYEQVLAHAGAEWTLLLTLESERHVVSIAADAMEFAEAGDIEPLRAIARTVVIRD